MNLAQTIEAAAVALYRGAQSIIPSRLHAYLASAFNSFLSMLTDRQFIYVTYFKSFRRFPNLSNPQTFTEKCQWTKVCGNHALMASWTDKVKAKELALDRIGTAYVIPTLFSGPTLPPLAQRTWKPPFVIKANHGSEMNIFVRERRDIDWAAIESKINEFLNFDYANISRERHYSLIKRQVLVEPFISESGTLPLDYKVFVFGGVPDCIQVDTDRETAHKRTFYDVNWNKMALQFNYPDEKRDIPKPRSLDMILRLASILAEPLPVGFVRVDFYEIYGAPYFGEVTFTPEAGLGKFDPREADSLFGRKWSIQR
jgi:hypothetical protein